MLDAGAHDDLGQVGTSPERRVSLHVHLLGTFRVVGAGQAVPEVAWPLRKARSLVKLLALTPGGALEREVIMGQLWPDLAPAAASNNLRHALHVARRALPPGLLAGSGRTLSLCPA